ncbi:hypothetical protein ACQ4PT_055587 [Festuca glaucescens]
MPHLTTSSAAAFGVAGGGGHPVFRPLPRRTPLRARAAWAAGGGVRTAELPQPTFYELLGISAEGSSFEDVRAAYRRMAHKYHPDVSPPDAAKEHTRRFIQVQEAYETLSDPSRRSSYDQALARGVCRLAFDPASRRHASNSAFYHQVDLHSTSLLPFLITSSSILVEIFTYECFKRIDLPTYMW